MTITNATIVHELESQAIEVQKKIESYKQMGNSRVVLILEEQYEGIINQMSEFEIS